MIIPVLNEAQTIDACLAQFEKHAKVEVIVVDGGSTDGTLARVETNGACRWLVGAEMGRAAQMNLGAQHATGEVLLFLHADTFLPTGGLDLIREVMQDPQVVGGRFGLRLQGAHFGFRLIAYMSTLRSKYLNITYGDQGIFVRRDIFARVGGYPNLMLFEDSEFCNQVRSFGKFVMLSAFVWSSARRWEKWGMVKTVFLMWVLRVLFDLGVSDQTLSRWYRVVR